MRIFILPLQSLKHLLYNFSFAPHSFAVLSSCVHRAFTVCSPFTVLRTICSPCTFHSQFCIHHSPTVHIIHKAFIVCSLCIHCSFTAQSSYSLWNSKVKGSFFITRINRNGMCTQEWKENQQ